MNSLGSNRIFVCVLVASHMVGCADSRIPIVPEDAGGTRSNPVDAGPSTDAEVLVDGGSERDAADDIDADGGAPTETPALRPIGTARMLEESCSGGAGSISGSTCVMVEVSCPGVAPLSAEVRHTPPVGDDRGTIVFGTGGGGAGFYDDQRESRVALEALNQAGFRLVQRSWTGEYGWLQGPGGVAALACRYATLLTWVHDTLRTPETPLCATGNSGGSGEVSYALAHYGREEILNLAVPTSGPPFGRIDYGCSYDSEWAAECLALVGDELECRPACEYTEGGKGLIDIAFGEAVCGLEASGSIDLLMSHSVTADEADFDYGDTRVHFLFGTRDCDAAVPQGLEFASQIESAVEHTFVAEARHNLHSSPTGAIALRDTLLAECHL